MKAIGGYLGLELNNFELYHKNAIKLNTARNALEYIIKVKRYKKIYLPYYSCDVLLQPIIRNNLKYEFYHINENLNPKKEIKLQDDEALLYINYFGIKNKTVTNLSKKYSNIIIDNSQAFFVKPLENIDTFYSPRKFFGVPDGALLYTIYKLPDKFQQDLSYSRFSHLLKRLDVSAEFGYPDFIENEQSLDDQPIKIMSKLTQALLKNIDYTKVQKQRDENFNFLHEKLKKYNFLTPIIESEYFPGAMVYPFLNDNKNIRKKLLYNKIYVATYWKNVLKYTSNLDWEYFLTNNLIPLPIDQRYSIEEMKVIVKVIEL